jgi:hypothetical protein
VLGREGKRIQGRRFITTIVLQVVDHIRYGNVEHTVTLPARAGNGRGVLPSEVCKNRTSLPTNPALAERAGAKDHDIISSTFSRHNELCGNGNKKGNRSQLLLYYKNVVNQQ